MAESSNVVIVGAGFGGIGMAIRLRRAGVTGVTVLEKAGDLGGTWRDNVYPGAACDVPSHLYSFSFEPSADGTRRYPPQAEILGYLRHCADKYGIENGGRHRGRGGVLRRGAGPVADPDHDRRGDHRAGARDGLRQLNRPAYPSFPNTFGGTAFHSARWDRSCDLTGKRVAAIGTGASAIQFVPHLASRASRVYVFQRSAPYVIDKPDRPYRPWERRLLRHVPLVHALSRARTYVRFESRALGFVSFPSLMSAPARPSGNDSPNRCPTRPCAPPSPPTT